MGLSKEKNDKRKIYMSPVKHWLGDKNSSPRDTLGYSGEVMRGDVSGRPLKLAHTQVFGMPSEEGYMIRH
jgi:hypothetical protein